MASIRNAAVARADCVCPASERDPAVWAKINDYLNLGVEAMHVPGRVVHGVCREADAIETERTHLSLS
jgi:hypothetical protein